MLIRARYWLLLSCLCVLTQSCMQTLTGPSSTGSVVNPQDYIWRSDSLAKGLDYYLIRQGVGSAHRVSSNDDIHIRDAALYGTAFVLHSSADSVVLDSIGVSSIFSLPAGYAFGGAPQTSIRYLGVNALLTIPGGILAATDSGIYFSDNETMWIRTSPLVVHMLVKDSSLNIFTAVGDSLVTSSNGGLNWSILESPHPGTRISALACSKVRLFVGYAAQGLGVDLWSGGSYRTSISAAPPTTAIAVRDDSTGEEVIIADQSGVGTYLVDTLVRKVPLTDVQHLYIDPAGVAYAGAASGGIYLRRAADSNWRLLPFSEQDTVADMVGHDVEGIFAVTNSGGVLGVILGNLDSVAATHATARALAVDVQNHILVGTDAGIVAVVNTQPRPGRLGPNSTITTPTAGGLTILEREGMNAPVQANIRTDQPTNFAWTGGTLLGPGLPDSGVRITARVMDHVDSIRNIPSIADSTKRYAYGDSYIIRYGFENADGSLFPSFPIYWLVYYARGIGPVWIQEYQLGYGNTYSISQQATLENK